MTEHHTKITTLFSIQGKTSGWIRGPFKTHEQAIQAAQELANQKSENVEIYMETVTTTWGLVLEIPAPK